MRLSPVTKPLHTAVGAPVYNSTPPVKVWAAIGIALLAFEGFLLTRWITGPHFAAVPSGPSVPPTWMRAVIDFWQVGGNVVLLVFLYYVVFKPWRRTGTFTTDGLFCLALLLTSIYDPLSNYTSHWLTYNAYFVNFGSVLHDIGSLSFNVPGATSAWPILFAPGAYVYSMLPAMYFGCWLMRLAQRRWSSATRVIGICYLGGVLFSILLEGLIYMRLGFYTYPGGHWPLFGGDKFFKFPLQEALVVGLLFAALSSLRFFTDDRGRTFVERGVDSLNVSKGKALALRFFGILAAIQLIFFAGYHLPMAVVALRPTEWPADIQKRSYFTQHVCGAGTQNACSAPNVPIGRQKSINVSPSGEIVEPGDYQAPQVIPFDVPRPRRSVE